MSETNVQKFKRLLSELFMFDHADLDFGIYRIMNAKRDEIRRFLDDDLLPQVRKEIEHLDTGKREQLLREREETLQQLRGLLVADPENNPKIQAIDAQLKQSVDVIALENEIFSDLYDFFRRYYSEGDYLALRRYKEGVYAIPYEGEEVKLHWANADQYYIKTSEYFRDYTFKLPDHRRVHFKLISADTEQNNNKSTNGDKRVFILCAEDFIAEQNGELVICFEYRVDPQKRKQDDLNQEAAQRILSVPNLPSWMMILGRPAPTDSNPDRAFLQKYLADYTSRNTFDYFIHKDLGAFLRRELDFFIKNEIMHLDDIELESAPRVEVYLSKIKALRRVAKKVIDFLEQLENFQKRLWLKKKFVIETNFCITLDRVPEELYPEIAANDAQREEWVRLFAIDEIKGDIVSAGYSEPLSVEFLQANRFLVLDTRLFNVAFKYKLLSTFDNIDEQLNGVLIHAENFHANALLGNKYANKIKCIYIDPPYNTGDDGFVYKDSYPHSSWISMMVDRISIAYKLLAEDGCIAVSIDQEELHNLRGILDGVFGHNNLVSLVTVKRGSVTGHKAINPGVVNVSEYVLIYAKNRSVWVGNDVYSERERDTRYNTFIINRDKPLSEWKFISIRDALAEELGIPKNDLRTQLGENYEARLDEFVYGNAASVMRLAAVNISGVGADFQQAVETSVKAGEVVIVHEREGFPDVYLLNGQRILFYEDKLTQIGDRLATAEKASDIWLDVLPNDLHNEGGVTLKKGKKPEALLSRVIAMGSDEADIVLDFFAGSGTSTAVAQKMHRFWLGVESSAYFDELPLTRLKNTLFGEQRGVSRSFGWKGGGIFKYLRLESYEDALNNLRLQFKPQQQKLLWDEGKDSFREDYLLHYMLDVESKGSASLLDLKQFVNPFNYQLEIGTETVDQTRPMTIDLVETFNYLLGLHVRRMQAFDHIRVVEGENRDGQQILIIWRNQEEIDNAKLDAFFQENGGHEANFDLIYVNGDNNLENLKQGNEIWQVLIIEEAFHQLMFDTQDV